MNERWTIAEMSRVVAAALNVARYDGQASGRVRQVPDLRTIRYYTTIGLLDPPAEMRGRRAYYGRRHVLQLAAIKQLQSQGRSLVDVQQALLGASDGKLARLAAIGPEFWTHIVARPDAQLSADMRRELSMTPCADVPDSVRADEERRSFWKAAPSVSAGLEREVAAGEPGPRVAFVLRIPVCPGVELVVNDVEAQRVDGDLISRLSQIAARIAPDLTEISLRATRGDKPA